MLEIMRAGGVAMWVVLFAGLAALVCAVVFARRPTERNLAVVRPLSVATVFAALAGIASDLGATMQHVSSLGEDTARPDVTLLALAGVGESMAPAILAFALLTVVWLLVAVGLRRQA